MKVSLRLPDRSCSPNGAGPGIDTRESLGDVQLVAGIEIVGGVDDERSAKAGERGAALHENSDQITLLGDTRRDAWMMIRSGGGWR
jgi:hypothetical protein